MERPGRRTRYLAAAAVVVLLVAGGAVLLFARGSSTGGSGRPAQSDSTRVLERAGATPSKSAQMVCEPEAAGDIASAIGAAPVQPLSPSWADHLYSCRYVYRDGVMTLSVKELSNRAETDAYFTALRKTLGQSERLTLGQGSFITNNGSVVVRKDYKVLLVDASGLPDQFGAPPATRSNVAVGVGLTVLGCWTGA
jgi:hypothetical protein